MFYAILVWTRLDCLDPDIWALSIFRRLKVHTIGISNTYLYPLAMWTRVLAAMQYTPSAAITNGRFLDYIQRVRPSSRFINQLIYSAAAAYLFLPQPSI